MATKDDIIEALKTVIDPELFIDVWTLGLIYDIQINDNSLDLTMTFTSAACPMGPELLGEVKQKSLECDGIDECNIEVVFDPPWQPSEELKATLGIL